MNLANKITISRICLIPIFVVFASVEIPYGNLIAAVIFIIAAATDGIDGYIARSRNQITTLGKFLDPLADKLLISAALICLVAVGKAAAWIVILIICREFAVTGMRSVAAAAGKIIAASPLGKIKTVSQIVALAFLFLYDSPIFNTWLPENIGLIVGQVFLYLALFFTIYSGIDYFYRNKSVFRED